MSSTSDDLQKLRTILERASVLSWQHSIRSVMVAVVGPAGEADFPELVEYLQSELRVEDAVYRMTRERIVLFLADVGEDSAREILERVLLGYAGRSSRAREPQVDLRYLEIAPGTRDLSIKDVLPTLFTS